MKRLIFLATIVVVVLVACEEGARYATTIIEENAGTIDTIEVLGRNFESSVKQADRGCRDRGYQYSVGGWKDTLVCWKP